MRRRTHGDGKADGDDVHERVLRSVAEARGHTAFPEQIAQHQTAEQRRHGGQEEAGRDDDYDGEEDLLLLGDLG